MTSTPPLRSRSSAAGGPVPISIGRRLDGEWSRLRTRPEVLRRATQWQLIEGPVHDLDHVLAAIGYEQPPSAANDHALRKLLELASDDEFAARVLVQRLVPGLLALVRRRGRMGSGHHAFEELLGALWISIRTFDVSRRPSCLAAALLSDAAYRAFRAPTRRRSAQEQPIDTSRIPLADVRRPSATDELLDLLDLAEQSGMADDDIDLIRRLMAARTPADVARSLNVTTRTIRNRRDRVTGRLREVVLAA